MQNALAYLFNPCYLNKSGVVPLLFGVSMVKDYSGLEGKTFECGVTVVRIIKKEEWESFGISPNSRHTYALCETHCSICGQKVIQVDTLVRGVRKVACSHAGKQSLADTLRANAAKRREAKTADDLERAENSIGQTLGIHTVESIVCENPVRVLARCVHCGNSHVVRFDHIGDCKCRCQSVRQPVKYPCDELTKKYPRLYNKLKSHWRKCTVEGCDGWDCYGAKGWHFGERWTRRDKNGKLKLNTAVAIQDCLALGWDENNPDLILEKDKKAIELGIREISERTVRFVPRLENSLHHFY